MNWYKNAVIYQIYPRSFRDSNGDGIGDLKGISEKLDYLASLHIDAIWISPFFKSPMKDFGYDVADYRDVDPMFGTLGDFKDLLTRAHQKGIKVIIDMVLNHSSDQHPWFIESQKNKTNPKADWYVWTPARPDGSAPNNWLAVFGGSSWTWNENRSQFYLHNFLVEQPDLNVRNPEVQTALLAECRFWLEMGVDGFRLDVCNFFMHDPNLRDNPLKQIKFIEGVPESNPYNQQEHIHDINQEENFTFLKKMRALTDEFKDRVLIAEIFNDGDKDLINNYIEPKGPIHTAYSFAFLVNDFPMKAIETALKKMSVSSPFWAFGNHDVPRLASRFAPLHSGETFSRQIFSFLATLKSGFFLYQGDELTLPEADVPFDRLQDPYGKAFYPKFKGRDGCRTPIPWDEKTVSANGWLPIPPEHAPLSVQKNEEDRYSELHFVRRLLSERKKLTPLLEGSFELLSAEKGCVSFLRKGESTLKCTFNFSKEEVILPSEGKILSAFSQNYEKKSDLIHLHPYGALVTQL